MPWEEEKHQIDDPVRLRRRAANLERELAAAPARESTLAFLRGILEEVRFALVSPLEEDGLELAVPPRRERLWRTTPGKRCRLGPEPVVGSAFHAAVSDWQRPEEPFAGAEPMVRIRFPPAGNLVRT
jgi:HEAT repeat protein